MKPLITIGCKTDHGGIVVEADASFLVEGKAVHVEGMRHICPKCKKTVSAISSGKGFLTVNSKTIIMAGDKASCGATFLPQQSIAVRTNGSGSGSGSSQGSPVSIFPSITQDDMIMGFSKVPKQSLTEEDKILTSEECRKIIVMLWGDHILQSSGEAGLKKASNSKAELPLNIRKEITSTYFHAVNQDEGMDFIESIMGSFAGVTSKAAAKIISKTIVTDIAKMEAEEKFKSLWNNEARQKYFKVGSSSNPIERFESVSSSIKLAIKGSKLEFFGNSVSGVL